MSNTLTVKKTTAISILPKFLRTNSDEPADNSTGGAGDQLEFDFATDQKHETDEELDHD